LILASILRIDGAFDSSVALTPSLSISKLMFSCDLRIKCKCQR